MSNYHVSVLLREAIQELHIQHGEQYIDATLGGGGHSREIIERGGKVFALDVDDDALAHARELFGDNAEQFTVVKGNFRDIATLARANGFGTVSGILFDLGVSSHQFDEGPRGFSFQADAELDMRMDQSLGVKAKDLVNALGKDELYALFTKLGEEPFARKIAGAIVDNRRIKPIETTRELEQLIRKAVPNTGAKINPATRVFQALRIAVNDELNSLREALPQALSLLVPGGRLAVITFHSLEDRIVKHQFLEFERQGLGNIVTKKPMVPTEEEVLANSRSRSAKLRVFARR